MGRKTAYGYFVNKQEGKAKENVTQEEKIISPLNKGNNPINLLVTIDRTYLAPLTVMLGSYIETNRETNTDLYIAHSSLEDSDFAFIEETVKGSKVHVHNVKITEHWFSEVPVLERLPEESFYRLLAFRFLPQDMERCLYLDPDLIVRSSLQSMYYMELGDHYIAASGHLHGGHNELNKKRLALKNQDRYINSGVMLMNLAEIRKHFSLEDILERLEDNIQRLIMGDQDMVNILFGEKTIILPEEIYNLDERTYQYFKKHNGWTMETVAAETAIVHYNGKYKPWLNGYKGELDCFYPEVKEKGAAPTKTIIKQIKSFFKITGMTPQQAITGIGMCLFALFCLLSYTVFGKELTQAVSDPDSFRVWLDQFGVFDEVIFILIRAVQTVVKFIPAEPLEIASGFVWGAIPGMLCCLIGNMLGTLVIFVLTRKYGKKIWNLFVPVKNTRLLKILEGNEKLYAMLFFLYLIPGSPKDGLTYFISMLPVKLVPFMVITCIARMPSVLSSTLCGSSLAEQQYQIAIMIFAITIFLAVLGGIAYKAFMKRKDRNHT